MKIIQGNLNGCRAADDLLTQLVYEMEVQIVFISEQYRNRNSLTWFSDLLDTAAIWVVDAHSARIDDHGSGNGYVWVRSRDTTFYSVYLSPNDSIPEFRSKLNELEDALRDTLGEMVVAGDFNARALEWGMPQQDTRGRLVMEMASRLDLSVVNTGSTPTYRRPGFGNSIPDITMVSTGLISNSVDWRVMEDYTGSDHNYITFQLLDDRPVHRARIQGSRGWNTRRLDGAKLIEFLGTNPACNIPTLQTNPTRYEVETRVDETVHFIQRSCDASMPRKKLWKGRREAYWWTSEIAELRKHALKLRRKAQRSRNTEEAAVRSAEHRAAKKELGLAIRASKTRCWREICREVDADPWGKGYKLVSHRLGSMNRCGSMDAGTMENIVDTLFPTHALRIEEDIPGHVDVVPVFTEEELSNAVTALKIKKAPGPDGVPVEVLKVVASEYPQQLLALYNSCLETGVFPARWKVARLALIEKGKGSDPDSPSSYRPICMLDTLGKLYEKLLKPRLDSAIGAVGGLSPKQYGFRKGRSTINAISEVTNAVTSAETACHQARPLVFLVTLDVRNAFNSAKWEDILGALRRFFDIPNYLLLVMSDYLRDRRVNYETTNGIKTKEVTAGVAQGSILGPDLWNVLYDSLLRLDVPELTLVGYADDIALVITARSAELAQFKINQAMRRLGVWMEEHGLQLALSKTEIVMLTKRRIPNIIPMTLDSEVIYTKASAKYLGVILDSRLNYWDHIRKACDRAATVSASLGRLMANVGGPRSSIRRVLMSVVQSILLYGAEIWASAMHIQKYRVRMVSVQRRGALRVACAYRTVSDDAALVVAGVIPIDLLARERQEIYWLSADLGRKEATARARSDTMEAWQRRWQESVKGRWTARLVKVLSTWTNRKHGEVNFFVCQFLTGHGYFGAYLHRMGKLRTPHCRYCPEEIDDACHTFFGCSRFDEGRSRLTSAVGVVTPDTIVEVMLRSEEAWGAVALYAESILRKKREEGCLADP